LGTRDAACNWLEDFLTSRSRVDSNQSDDVLLQFGVPYSPVAGPKRVFEYAEDITCQFDENDLCHLTRLDYCNGGLAGLPSVPLQQVLHAAARLVDELKPNGHVTAAQKNLRWLPVKQRIEYKLRLLMHAVSVGQVPVYMSDKLTYQTTFIFQRRLIRPGNNPETR